MSPSVSGPDIRHDSDMHRFATTVDDVRAYLDYRVEGRTLVITHTWVPEAIGGRGIAGQLVESAFLHAREAGLKVEPACSYAAAWVARHPDYQPLLA